MAHQFIIGVQSFDRITKRTDDLAIWNMGMNPVTCFRVLEIGRRNLTDHTLSGAMHKISFVPVQTVLIVPCKKMSLFHIARQADMVTQNCVQPRRSRPRRTYRNEIGQSPSLALVHYESSCSTCMIEAGSAVPAHSYRKASIGFSDEALRAG